MNEWLLLALAILACYRLARFAVLEEGPYGFMLKFRVWAGAYDYGQNGEPVGTLGRLFACPYCTGMWIALALAVALCWERPLLLPLYCLALRWAGFFAGSA